MFPPFRILLTLALLITSVQTVFAQEPTRDPAASLTCQDLDGSYVISQETPPVYLGFFGNEFVSDSIMNPYGTYGSEYDKLSVRNAFGPYGSPYGTYSANNQFTSTPPGIFKYGFLIAFLTTNTTIMGGVPLAMIDASCDFISFSPAISPPPETSTLQLYIPVLMK